MTAAERFHPEHAAASVMEPCKRVRHIGFRPVRDADARHIVQRMDHIERRSLVCQGERTLHGGDMVGRDSDRPDHSPFPQVKQGIECLPVAAQGVDALLFVEHKDVDIVPVQRASGFVHGGKGPRSIPDVCLGRDHHVVAMLCLLQTGTDMRVVPVILRGIEKIHPTVKRVGKDLPGTLRTQIRLQRAYRERPDRQAGYLFQMGG